MKCPFVREAQVRECRAAAFRMPIPHAEGAADDLCLTFLHTQCEVFRSQNANGEAGERCPFVSDGTAQHCSASAMSKLIPLGETSASRCFNGGHRYCEEFAETLAAPDKPAQGLRYTANHMWVDVAADGLCYIGADDLLATVLGNGLESVGFAAAGSDAEPAALIRSNGVDWPVVFPERVHVTARNLYLRTNPRRLVTHPYTLGWLFECVHAEALASSRRLIPEGDARDWLESEWERLAQFVYSRYHGGSGLLNDGGRVMPDFAERLGREERLALFSEFFAPSARVRRVRAKRK